MCFDDFFVYVVFVVVVFIKGFLYGPLAKLFKVNFSTPIDINTLKSWLNIGDTNPPLHDYFHGFFELWILQSFITIRVDFDESSIELKIKFQWD